MANRVLVVEDDQKTREWVVWYLNDSGFLTDEAGDGIEAIKILAGQTPPDLLVLDLHLPGMNGIDVLKHLRALPSGSDMPVIIITGVYKGIEYAKKAHDLFHVNGYIEKPFRIETLIGQINKTLTARRDRAPAKPEKSNAAVLEPGAENRSAAPPPRQEPPIQTHPAAPVQGAVQAKSAPQIIQGSLSEKPFDNLLLQLWKNRATGSLKVTSHEEDGETVERKFAFLSGRPVLGRSDASSEDFGAHLVSRGMATPEENREYQRLLASGGHDPENIFISMGCLTPDGFIVERVRHLEELLIGCFTLGEGGFRFDPSDLEVGAVAGANIPRIVHEGHRRHLSENRLGTIFTQLAGKYLRHTAQYYDHLPSLELDEGEIKFFEEITGSKMLKDHAESGDFHKVLKATATLLALGMVEAADVPGEERVELHYPIRSKTPAARADVSEAGETHEAAEEPGGFEDLGDALSDELGDLAGELGDLEPDIPDREAQVNEEHKRLEEELRNEVERLKDINYYEFFHTKLAGFRIDEVKKTYFEKRKKFSPESFIEWASGDVISLAEKVLTQLNTAYNTLSNVVSKEKYDELLESTMPKVTGDRKEDRFQAQVQFESGKAFVEMEEYNSAEQAFLEAIDLNPNVAAYHAWLGWAIYSKNTENSSNVSRAKKEIATALKTDSRCAIAFAFKGAIILDQGNLDLAEVELRRALKFNPRSKFARRNLKDLQSRRESEKKGIIGRIFS